MRSIVRMSEEKQVVGTFLGQLVSSAWPKKLGIIADARFCESAELFVGRL